MKYYLYHNASDELWTEESDDIELLQLKWGDGDEPILIMTTEEYLKWSTND